MGWLIPVGQHADLANIDDMDDSCGETFDHSRTYILVLTLTSLVEHRLYVQFTLINEGKDLLWAFQVTNLYIWFAISLPI